MLFRVKMGVFSVKNGYFGKSVFEVKRTSGVYLGKLGNILYIVIDKVFKLRISNRMRKFWGKKVHFFASNAQVVKLGRAKAGKNGVKKVKIRAKWGALGLFFYPPCANRSKLVL